MSSAPIDPRAPRFPVTMKYPNFGDTTDNFNFSDYVTISAASAISCGAGYALGKPVRGPSMVVTGVLGTIAGFLYAFQNSSQRLQGFQKN
ncbi:hypothetical protein SDRG_06756 [Saprolegnia diclina VS20]|uniref:NADH-ubiquinone oxidoreductase 21kDa subunit N-terminal domain-containing protein n=2 Tax=Saprolegnia TaxID=4769 RepID=A0A067CT38_SAPPC|nr:hypothetical protein SDRG_06756 [Saprolegnia diclina VS20]XP_012199151.1 hypothetical protein SPRG_05157 [Saprolegnia parasitica CBS 223.65]EQC36018.1 hypothetical protein SDRG_06756 [Saprolegnia diclina VS20]KDO29967.1 hypothetical protein SPRG_05157 [Saprolegnia parasitica CBS 223.65]|eukprot:XP_008610780.1 hypothetical protein SDRG_06756 [Saprolegnia diclina VS20]